MNFVLSGDPSFVNKMKITDKLVISVTYEVLLKGKLMKSIEAHVHLKLIYNIRKMEKEIISAQQWKVETETDKKEDF